MNTIGMMILLLFASAFFSGTETAVFSLTPEAARRLRRRRHADRLLTLLRNAPADLLSAILFGNLIVNILFFCTGAVLADRWSAGRGPWSQALGGALILAAIILFGEILPKAAGVAQASRIVQATARPMVMWYALVKPFRRLARTLLHRFRLQESSAERRVVLTPGELRELLDAVRHEPGFGSREKEMLEDIVNLSDVRVREMMVPRVRVMRKPLDADPEQLLDEARQREYSRILIYREHDENPLGYVRTRDLFMERHSGRSLRAFIRPLVFVPETQRADRLLQELIQRDLELVAVVDEYGGLAGVVSGDDLFAEVVGDSEPEPAEQIEQIDDCTYRLNGQLPIRAWRELFTGLLPGSEVDSLAFDTLGGLIVSRLGRLPRTGDRVFVGNIGLTVENMHRRHIGTVLLHLESTGERPV